MTLQVATAVTGAAWEGDLVAALERDAPGVHVVRRCVDLADLLATASAGTAEAVLLSADLRRLDREALARLAAAGLGVVGLHTPGDEDGERRLRQLGLIHVLPADAAVAVMAAAIAAAVRDAGDAGTAGDPSRTYGWSSTAGPDPVVPTDRRDGAGTEGGAGTEATAGVPHPGRPGGSAAAPSPPGRLVAVWGPAGAPGRSTVAVTLAAELAALGEQTLLADADVYGGVVAQLLGLLDESPGLAAAVRLANTGALDLPALAGVAPTVGPRLRVLTGIARADRWPELRPAGLEHVWALARRLASVTVVDCGFCLEQDEELSYDTAAPRRNGATLATLHAADVVLAVGGADPVGVQRLVRGLSDLREAVPGVAPRVVLNRVRRGPVGSHPERQLAEALERYAGVRTPAFVPEDRAGLDSALLHGRTLTEAAPGSPARAAVAALAAEVAGTVPATRPRRARLRARRPGLAAP